tara:strand:+ start:1001 stop:1174 length:174 start_codon:yes stop_codon:yes gene_type:complete
VTKLNKEKFIADCKKKSNWDYTVMLKDKRIVFDKEKLKKVPDMPFDYYDCIIEFNDN